MSGSLFSGQALEKARSALVLVCQHQEMKLNAPFGLYSSIKLLFAAQSTKHSLLDEITSIHTRGKGTPEWALSKGGRMDVCRC